MSDDTRDIVIETRADVRNLTRTVEEIAGQVDALVKKSNEQDGMYRAGRLMIAGIGFAGGAAATFIAKILPFSAGLPR
jgi:4-diphosphocytidyl-2C-methyl-D-erythritol kinase